jgi:hypothetical protein
MRRVLAGVVVLVACGAAATARAQAPVVDHGEPADPVTGALVLSAAENPAQLTPLAAPQRGKSVLPRRADGVAQLGLDADSAIASGVRAATVMSALQTAHIGYTRLDASWGFLEPQPGHYDFRSLDGPYKAAIAAGIRPIITLVTSPQWAIGYQGGARDSGCDGSYCMQAPAPGAYGEWGRFASAVARRYRLAAAIEIWNEPNTWFFWHTDDTDAAAYTRLLAAAYDPIKAAVPAMRVLGGALANTPSTEPTTANDCGPALLTGHIEDCRRKHNIGLADFLRGMLAAGAAAKLDALSFHPYPVDAAATAFSDTFASIHDVLTAGGQPALRLVVTEFGAPAPTPAWPDDDAQALQTVDLYSRISGVLRPADVVDADHVDAVLFFEVAEVGRGLGWMSRLPGGALAPRTVYCQVADLLGSRPSACPGPERYTLSVGGGSNGIHTPSRKPRSALRRR